MVNAVGSACRFPSASALILIALALGSSTTLPVGAQEAPAPFGQPRVQPSARPKPLDKDTPREIIYPHYSLRQGWESRLELMDRTPRVIEFTMEVHGLSGQTVTGKPMTITPDQALEIDMRQFLNDLGADIQGDFSEGSISIYFKGTGNPLGGRLLVQGPRESWNLGPVWRENESGYGMIPPRLDTLWWDLGGSRDVEITVNNTSSTPETAEFVLEWDGKQHAAPALQFGPHETKLLSVTQTLAAMGVTPYQAVTGGLSIVPRDGRAVLIAQGKMTDADTGKVIGLVFNLPQLQVASALHAIAVPISVPAPGSLFAGQGNFTPHIAVRNLLDSEQTLTLTVEYPGKDGAAMTTLDPLRIERYTTQDIRLDNYYASLHLPLPFCELRIQYSGPPGSVEAEVRVVEENSGSVEEIPVANEGNGYAGSLASYWSFNDRKDIYVFFTDMGDQPGRFAMTIDAGGVRYFAPLVKLHPRETQYVNLRELIAQQKADLRGHLIPKDATEGRLFFIRMDNVPMYGRILEVPRQADAGVRP
jgi:hypothetical protein